MIWCHRCQVAKPTHRSNKCELAYINNLIAVKCTKDTHHWKSKIGEDSFSITVKALCQLNWMYRASFTDSFYLMPCPAWMSTPSGSGGGCFIYKHSTSADFSVIHYLQVFRFLQSCFWSQSALSDVNLHGHNCRGYDTPHWIIHSRVVYSLSLVNNEWRVHTDLKTIGDTSPHITSNGRIVGLKVEVSVDVQAAILSSPE